MAEYQKEFYSQSGEFPTGTWRKAQSGMGNTTAKGTFDPEIDFSELYGATTPATDVQFINSIIPESAGLPDDAPKTGGNSSKGKKGY